MRPSARIRGYALLSAAGLLTAVLFGRPEAIAIAAPFALALVAGLVPVRGAEPRMTIEPTRVRTVEGLPVVLHIAVESPGAELEVVLPAPPWIGSRRLVLAEVAPGRWAGDLVVTPRRWGAWRLDEAVIRRGGLLSLVRTEHRVELAGEIRVHPSPQRLRALIAPHRTGSGVGEWAARTQRGDGVELAEVRPWAPGDPSRRINAHLSARRGELIVTDRHPERNADVVLLLDTFAEVRTAAGGTLDDAVRAAATLADAHLRVRDRVGVVGFGGVLHWLLPGSGLAHATRIADALITSEVVFSYVWRDVDYVPPRMLPPQALIVALTPLLDDRTAHALLQLRHRGRDLVLVDVSPVDAVARSGALDPLALRLWVARRAALRARFGRAGVAVSTWQGGALNPAIEEVTAWRRRAGRQALA